MTAGRVNLPQYLTNVTQNSRI